MRNIDRLKELLQNQNIPTFRKDVDLNGRNLTWLRKHLLPSACGELRRLLAYNTAELAGTYTEDT